MANKMICYKIFRIVLGPIYKLWYNPKITGKENIPKEGRFIIVGNHINIMDQCNVVISTKRDLHYMAKKEYFDNKKVAWFFRSAGCIPVDRSKKDESAKSSAIEVLEQNEALGLFPEGTRNGMKEERAKELYDEYIEDETSYKDFYKKIKKSKTSQVNFLEELMKKGAISKDEFIDNLTNADEFLNLLINEKRLTRTEYFDHILLPLKYGAVSMAKKTNSKIIPFVITGDYKFRSNNLRVTIGEPIDVEDDLEEANNTLDKTMKDMIKDNYEKYGK